MTEESSARARYDRWAPSYDADMAAAGWAAPLRLHEALRAHRGVESSLRVLDVGVGTGGASEPYLASGARVVGLDVSSSMLDVARAKHPAFHVLLEHDLETGFPAVLRPGDADVVIACGVLHLLAAAEPTLGVLAEALAPGGVVAFTYVPSSCSRFEPSDRRDAPEAIERAVAALGWQMLLHDTFVAYREGETPVKWARVVARDPRPAEPLPEALRAIDRTACVDRARLMAAFHREPWRLSDDPAPVTQASSDLIGAVREGLAGDVLDLRGLPWPLLRPPSSDIPGCDVLAIFPHPDDESVYAGGTIAGMAEAGARVHLAVATDGGGGRGGSDLCRRRMRELLAATALLGIRAVECLGWPDFGKYHDAARTRPFTQVETIGVWGLDRTLEDLVECIRVHRPAVVLSLDPEVDPNYSLHGHHLALGVLVAVAFHLAADPSHAPEAGAAWAAFEHRVMSPIAEAELGEVFEVDRERKRAALLAHASQRYSTEALCKALEDPSRPALEVSRRVQVRARVPLWLAKTRGPRIDRAIDWAFETRRVLRCERPRGELVEVLRAQARARPRDVAVDRAIDRLADPRTVAVVTGQQVGLLGGPALALHKALAAVALSDRLEASGVRAVPVFWMATQDHDLEEVRVVPCIDGASLRLPIASDGRPVGDRALGNELGPFVDAWIEAVGAREIAPLLHACWEPSATFGGAFASFFARITEGMGLVLLDPSDPQVARLARPVLERELLGPRRMSDPLAIERGRMIEEGRRETIDTTRDVLQLFITDQEGRRKRLRPTPAGVAWSGGELDASAAAALLEHAPERFTPSALLRPLVQDALLPTVAYVGGPTEVRYLGQLTSAYAWAELPMPRILRRPSVLASTHADVSTLLAAGGREILAHRDDPEAAIGRSGLARVAQLWLEQVETLIDRLVAWREGAFEPSSCLEAYASLDASAHTALVGLDRVLPTWSTALGLAKLLFTPDGPVAPHARAFTRALRGLVRVRRALLREGRRASSEAIAAWRRVSPRPAAPERRASVAEVLARLGPAAPHAILRALRRNLVADVVVQGGELS
jgi:bacillithiol biosynthesis cysteine-adding enzyme BshC